MNVIVGAAVVGSMVAGYVYRKALTSLFAEDEPQTNATEASPYGMPVNTPLRKVQNDKKSSMSWDGTPLDYSAAALNAELKSKWMRPLKSLAVHTDIPRLIRKMEIIADDGAYLLKYQLQNNDTINIGPTEPSRIVLLKVGFLALCSQLCEEESQIETEFGKYFRDEEGELALCMMSFLKDVVGEDSKLTRILKACNQSMLAPAVVRMKVGLNQKVAFKDLQGGWRISISFLPDDGSPRAKGKGFCKVVHLRQEQSFDPTPTSKFELSWKLELLFDRDMTELLETHMTLTSLTFAPEVPPRSSQQIREALEQFFAPYKAPASG